MGFLALPDGYVEVRTVDFLKNKKTMAITQIATFVAAVILVIIGNTIESFSFPNSSNSFVNILLVFSMILLIILYIVAHELVHALFMKTFSRRKVKFGYNGLYAFVGSEAYFNKKQFIIISIAPVVLFGIVLLLLNIFISMKFFWLIYILQVANLSGAAGDIYMMILLSRLPADILVKDEGIKIVMYSRML